jgi:Tfp pilus assembly pilus retraction ATPase PilT
MDVKELLNDINLGKVLKIFLNSLDHKVNKTQKTVKDYLNWTANRIERFKELTGKKLSLIKAYEELETLNPCGVLFILNVYKALLSNHFQEVKIITKDTFEKIQDVTEQIKEGVFLIEKENIKYLILTDPANLIYIPHKILSETKGLYLLLPCSQKQLNEFLQGKKVEKVEIKDLNKDIEFWATLFIKGVQEGWGDIFLSAIENGKYLIQVRNKIGNIENLMEIPKERAEQEIRKLVVWTKSKADTKLQLYTTIDASLNYKHPSSFSTKEKNDSFYYLCETLTKYKAEADFRIAIAPNVYGKFLSIRILPKNREIKDISQLGYSEQKVIRLKSLTRLKQGLIIVSGPTGSGKSTLLYAIVKIFVKDKRRVLSIEDPVEATISGVNQVQVTLPVYNEKGETIGVDFALAIRNFLRQNPDVIVVGETRDTETAKKVLEASNTGHLVLTTIHANDEFSTIRRLVELSKDENTSEEVIIETAISQLKAVLSQRLVRTLCPKCKAEGRIEKVTIDEELLSKFPASVSQHLRKIQGSQVYLDPNPNNTCGTCNGGYIGRKPVLGILEMTQELQDFLIGEKMQVTRNDLRKIAKKTFSPMVDDALKLLQKGEIGLYTFAEIV